MTTPSERYRALVDAETFLVSLIVPSSTPGVPKKVRERARRILRHYPYESELEAIARKTKLL